MGSPCYGSYFYKSDYLNQVRCQPNVQVVEYLDGYISEVVARSTNITMADCEMVFGISTSFSTGVLPNFNSGLPGVVQVAAGAGYLNFFNQLPSHNSGRASKNTMAQSTENDPRSKKKVHLHYSKVTTTFFKQQYAKGFKQCCVEKRKGKRAKKKIFDDFNDVGDEIATKVTIISKESAADLNFSSG